MARNATQVNGGARERLSGLLRDVGYALRQLTRAPGFTAAAIGTLALGIGATSAIFSLVWAVVLKPLPGVDPQRTVAVESLFEGHPGRRLRRKLHRLAGQGHAARAARRGGRSELQPQRVRALGAGRRGRRLEQLLRRVSHRAAPGPDLRSVGGRSGSGPRGGALRGALAAALRRGPGRARPGNPARRRHLHGGGGHAGPVRPPPRPDAALGAAGPHADAAGAARRALPPGRGHPEGRRHPRARPAGDGCISAQLAKEYPANNFGRTVRITSLGAFLVGDTAQQLFILLGAVLLVLVIACLNVGNLLLARGTARTRELAVRAALGAGARRIVRQLLTESVVLAVLGGAVGVVLAAVLVQLLRAAAPADVPRLGEASLDGVVLAFALRGLAGQQPPLRGGACPARSADGPARDAPARVPRRRPAVGTTGSAEPSSSSRWRSPRPCWWARDCWSGPRSTSARSSQDSARMGLSARVSPSLRACTTGRRRRPPHSSGW